MMSSLALLFEGAGLAGLALAAVTDLRSRLIPNTLVLWVIAAGGAARLLTAGPHAWLSLAIAGAVFAPLAVLAYRDLIGGGDAKMIPAATLLVEPSQTFGLLLAIAVAGGALSAFYWAKGIVGRSTAPAGDLAGGAPEPSSSPSSLAAFVPHPSAPAGVQLPYGVAILAGVAFTLLRLA
ncbi:prepilin peptidase [Phenylobacterium sp.]|uniref:prepilin peptidase n=1 Tax=Phenylobacterium sp. TaxID=1871053 RepID=UPI0039193A86